MACSIQQEKEGCVVQDIAFADLPGQTRLFTKYQEDPDSLREFYPNASLTVSGLSVNIREVLDNYHTDRKLLCDAIELQNRNFNAPDAVFTNIERLRLPDTVAIVTGQQAGSFTGPIYTIYKALTAIKTVDQLRAIGVNAVPIFWIATEDHDFDEVAAATFINSSGGTFSVKSESDANHESVSVGNIPLDEKFRIQIDEIFESLERTEFSDGLRQLIDQACQTGDTFGRSFGKLLTSILGSYGLILLDPLDQALKQLAAPVYVQAIRKRNEILSALKERDLKLQLSGFHSQVLIDDDHFPMFWHDQKGRRLALRLKGNDKITTKDGSNSFSVDELEQLALQSPEQFSPSVLLRGVVQDFLLPTLCYFGGGAEAAYFAQTAEVYRVLSRPVTAVMHRQSFSVVEAKHLRTMTKYGIDITDVIEGLEGQIPRLAEEFINPSINKSIAESEERISIELDRLYREFSAFDLTLAESLVTRRKKMVYHIAAIREKFYQSAFRHDADLKRRVESLFNALLPKNQLQERVINIGYFLNKFGNAFIDLLYNNTDPDNRCHRVIYLK